MLIVFNFLHLLKVLKVRKNLINALQVIIDAGKSHFVVGEARNDLFKYLLKIKDVKKIHQLRNLLTVWERIYLKREK